MHWLSSGGGGEGGLYANHFLCISVLINHKATKSKTNTGSTALERSVEWGLKHFYGQPSSRCVQMLLVRQQ